MFKLSRIIMVIFVLVISVTMVNCDDNNANNNDNVNYSNLHGTTWSYSIFVAELNAAITGYFSITTQNKGIFTGSGTYDLSGLHMEFDIDGEIDADDNIVMVWDMTNMAAHNIEIYYCEYNGDNMAGLAKSSELWENANFEASKITLHN
ncbi:MAG: hypothetical protein A2161_09825 [Candidatus Schekmanbacteria bacterium RBG_13_48_7]|uniref:Lipoprotein n=1 Tax=Candidatus Schekmanbacteria bacterium RBG_13_48_7 TaxID=1817878 RepID=A0A1F7RMM3_9BACT|nr:MAG: hypothetical protein A2161_09825 [Candidatus Schekmanbacteria bacterium RBG_13_48_7]